MSPTSAGGARIPKQAASISPASLKRQEEVLPMAKLEQRRYKICTAIFPGIEGSCLRTIAPSLMGGRLYLPPGFILYGGWVENIKYK